MNWRQELAEQAQAATPGPRCVTGTPHCYVIAICDPDGEARCYNRAIISGNENGESLHADNRADVHLAAACTPERIQKLLAVAAAGERVKRHTDARLDTGNVLDKIRNAKARLTAMADLFDALAKLEGTP